MLLKKLLFAIIILYFSFSDFKEIIAQMSFHKQYTVNDGLPSSVIYDIAQDSTGLIWIASDYGVSKYDGYRFENFTKDNGLAANSNVLIFEGKHGYMWFLSYSGKLSYTDGWEVRPYEGNDTLSVFGGRNFASTLFVDNNNSIWFTYSKDTLKSVRITEDLEIFIVDTTMRKRSNFSKLFRNSVTQNQYEEKTSIKKDSILSNTKLYKIGEKYYTLGEDDRLIYSGNTLVPGGEDCLIENIDTYREDNGTIWLRKKWDGVYVYNLQYQNLPLRLLPNIRVTKILKDRNAHYWIATEGNGLYYLPSVRIYVYNKKQGLPNDNIISLEVDNNRLYFATNDGKLFVSVLSSKAHLKNRKELLENETSKYCRDIYLQAPDNLWVITSKYLRYNSSGIAKPLRFRVAKKSYEFHECNNGDIIVAMIEGFCRYDKNTLVYDSRSDGFAEHVRTIYEDNNNVIWLGTMEGVFSYDGFSYKFWGDSLDILGDRITTINGYNNEVWIGTRSNGIIRIDKHKITSINVGNGLSSNMVKAIMPYSENLVWVGTMSGLNKIELDHNGNIISIKKYSVWDGLISNEINDLEKYSGYIIVATNFGLCIFDPTLMNDKSTPPFININGLSVNNFAMPYKKIVNIGDTAKSVIIDYLGISFDDPGNITYRYKILWSDEFHSPFTTRFKIINDWVETRNTSLQLNVIPGHYTFSVQAKDEKGEWTMDTKSLDIIVAKPLIQQIWFHILIIIVIILMVSFIFLIIMRNRKKKNEIRVSLILSEQKALRAQMNPHFIFNSLNSIQTFILERNDEKADMYLSNFSSLMRKVLENSKYNLISLTEELETLEMYLQIENLRFENRFNYKIEVGPEIDTDDVMIPPSIIQPYLENAIWHGLMPKKNPGFLLLKLSSLDRSFIRVEIEDDGIGIKASNALNSKKKHHKSTGMKNIEERISLLNKITKGGFSIQISDLIKNKNENPGTKVSILIPLNISL